MTGIMHGISITIDDMIVTGDTHGYELACLITGEIFDVPSIDAGRKMRAISIRTNRLAYDFARVRNDQFNGTPSFI